MYYCSMAEATLHNIMWNMPRVSAGGDVYHYNRRTFPRLLSSAVAYWVPVSPGSVAA